MIVIADDITGAAEIAGIAKTHGEQVRLLTAGSVCAEAVGTEGVTVVATDTRSMTETEANDETRRILSCLLPSKERIFKKTDSALRGHVVTELRALKEATGCRIVYMPANPSRARIIKGGVYYVNGKPIHETDFSFDPEFPAHTATLKERFPEAEQWDIVMPDAESMDDVRCIVAEYDDGMTIFAGAADLFSGVLGEREGEALPPVSMPSCEGKTVVVLCGSTQSKPLDIGIPTIEMPREVYDGTQTAAEWTNAMLADALASLILTIPHRHKTGKDIAVHLRSVMAEVTQMLMTRHCPDELIIEGGATAWAVLHAIGWTRFEVIGQAAAGVVRMLAPSGTIVTLKPGSYPWGGLFQLSNT